MWAGAEELVPAAARRRQLPADVAGGACRHRDGVDRRRPRFARVYMHQIQCQAGRRRGVWVDVVRRTSDAVRSYQRISVPAAFASAVAAR